MWMCLFAALTMGADEPKLEPLTEVQTAKLRELVRVTQETGTELRSQLAAKQRALAFLYGKYDLDERRADELEAEILELQKRQLANYRKLQTELRGIVGADRFAFLKQRIDRVLAEPEQKKTDRKEEPKS